MSNVSHPIRIAWIGTAGPGGGVPGFGRDLLRGLADRDLELTIFTPDEVEPQRERLGHPPEARVRFVYVASGWKWGRWYSRNSVSIFFSGLISRALTHGRLVRKLVAEHQSRSFDVVVQFSQFELLSLRRYLNRVPPVVVFPCVHAAGELRWHKRESRIALQSERLWAHLLVRANLRYRAARQRRDVKRVALQIGMSNRFNELVRDDYGVDRDRQCVVYQPAIPPRNGPGPAHREHRDGQPIRILFVGRIAVRKGIEQIVELSRRISDLENRVEIEVVGGASFWSNYMGEVSKLNPKIARYLGPLAHDRILLRMAESDLLIMPSVYEPGGIVVAEAMSQGCLPVVSDEVGSAEPLSADVCERFAAGNVNDFEAACRRAIGRVQAEGPDLRRRVALEAQRCFSPEAQVEALFAAISVAAGGRAKTL